jgi:WD40 repeat protein
MRDIKFLNNKYLVTGGDNAKLSFYNISTGKLVKNIDMGTDNFIYSIDLNSQNENKLAIGNYKTKLGLYNIILASDYESGTGTGLGGGSGGGSQYMGALPEVSPPP